VVDVREVRRPVRGSPGSLIIVLSVLAAVLAGPPAARADRAYTPRWATTDHGTVTLAGNTVLSCPIASVGCSSLQFGGNDAAGPPDRAYEDVDGDATTFDSSGARVRLPAGATVLKAVLYWSGDTTAGTGPGAGAAPAPASRDRVKLKAPGASSYTTVLADTVDVDGARPGHYQGSADITTALAGAGAGNAYVADVQAGTGAGRAAGWAIAVAFRDPTRPMRRLQILDGFLPLTLARTSIDVPLSFVTPAGTVTGRIGGVVWEGNRGVGGDSATLNGIDLTDSANAVGDVWNSSASTDGATITDGNPNHVNQTGVDVDDKYINGVLSPMSQGAVLRLGATTDQVTPGAIVLSSDESAPQNVTAPAITGDPRDAHDLSASLGTWNATPTVTYTRQWQRCNTTGGTCTAISGATGATYTLTGADIGSTLRVVVTAVNDAGTTTSTSAPSMVISADPPVNTGAPTLSGATRDGATLTADRGTWTGTPTVSYAYQWRRCDTAGASCADIAGATNASYALAPADVGATVRIAVTATNAGGSATATSSPSGVIAPDPAANTVAPTVSGIERDTQTLLANRGTWTGTPTIAYAYQWQRCNASGVACADIPGATTFSQTLAPADVGATLRVRVTATNAAGSTTATSAATGVIAPDPPAATSPPTVSAPNGARDGETLIADRGVWTGTPTVSFTYQWQRCAADGTGCASIAGSTSTSHQLTPADVDMTLRVRVTATNAAGPTVATSAPSAKVAPAPPAVTGSPTLSGVERDAGTLTATPGSWTGTPTITYAYRWRRCDAAGASCAEISGATATSYTLTPADVSQTVRVQVTATNAGGTQVATSAASGAIAPDPPATTTSPSVSGTERDTQTLTADRGAWSGTPVLAYAHQWKRCDSAGAACTDIPGATGASYTLTPADVNGTVRVRVTATNAGGSATATSAATGVIAPDPPAATTPPAISGTERDTQTLTADRGQWTGTPVTTYALRWRRCDAAGSACADIAGATSSSYVLTPDDVGFTIRVRVTATNAGGSTAATSAASRAVAPDPAAPGATPPSIGGTPMHEATLTAGEGTWSGTPDLTFTYQWRRCDTAGAGCTDVTGATRATYAPVDADIGQTLRVLVTATNAGGAQSALSAPSAMVLPAPPASTSAPTTSVERSFGGPSLVADRGTWSGTRPMDHDVRWERCDADGSGCATVAGATQTRYRMVDADVGKRLRLIVTARNAAGAVTAASAISGVVEGPPAVQPDPDPPPDPTPTPTPPPTTSTSTPAPAPAATPAPDAPQPPLTSSVPVQPAATPPAAEPAHTPAPTSAPASLGALPGSLIAPTTCQTLTSGAGIARTDLPESGPVRLRIRSDAIITLAAPMTIRLTAARLNRLKVRLALDGRPARAKVTATEQRLTLSPSALVKAADHRLTIDLIRPNGGGRRLSVSFRTAPCKERFTSAFYRTRSGTGLRLRMDSDRALGSVGFTVPAPLALHGEGAPRLAGRLRYVVAPGRSKIVKLTLPGKGTSGTLLAGGANGPTVRFNAKGFVVEGLPAATGIAELTLFGRTPRQPASGAAYAFGARVTPYG